MSSPGKRGRVLWYGLGLIVLTVGFLAFRQIGGSQTAVTSSERSEEEETRPRDEGSQGMLTGERGRGKDAEQKVSRAPTLQVSVRGRVLEVETRAPVAGATVAAAFRLEEAPLAVATSSADGTFTLGISPRAHPPSLPEYYLVTAVLEARDLHSFAVAVEIPIGVSEADDVLLEVQHVARTRLVAEGEPKVVSGAGFVCRRLGPSDGDEGLRRWGESIYNPIISYPIADARGVADVLLMPGLYWFAARADSGAAWGPPQSASIASISSEVHLHVPSLSTPLVIHVVDENDRAVSGAWVSFSQKDQMYHGIVAPSGPVEGRAGGDLVATGTEDLFVYADAAGLVGFPIARDLAEPMRIAVGTPFHEVTSVSIGSKEATDDHMLVRLRLKPRLRMRVEGLPSLPGGGSPEVHWDVRRLGTAPAPPAEGSAEDFLTSSLDSQVAAEASAPGVYSLVAPGEGLCQVTAALDGGIHGATRVEGLRRGSQTDGTITLPASRRIRLALLTPKGELNGLRGRRLGVFADGLGPPSANGARQWLRVYEWDLAHAESWVFLDRSVRRVIVAGETVQDDLPSLPRTVELAESDESMMTLVYRAEDLGELTVTVLSSDSAPRAGADVGIGSIGDEPYEGWAKQVKARMLWVPIEKDTVTARLAPGHYRVVGRRGSREAAPVEISVISGQTAAIDLNLAGIPR